MSAGEFVRRALTAEGHAVREIRPGLLEVTRSHSPAERIAITPLAADCQDASNNATPCFPGQRAFERLVEQWANRQCHRVLDLRDQTQPNAKRLAQEWCARYSGATLVSSTIRTRKPHISGHVLVRTSAENQLDRHQKLVEQPVTPAGHGLVSYGPRLANAPPLQASVSLQGVAPRTAIRIQQLVSADNDIHAFALYYLARQTNELSRTGGNRVRSPCCAVYPAICSRISALWPGVRASASA